jgi:transcription elongation factor SPT6
MSMRDLVVGEAELASEDDESFDEETGELQHRKSAGNGSLVDSSDEDEDEDDEEAERAVCSLQVSDHVTFD